MVCQSQCAAGNLYECEFEKGQHMKFSSIISTIRSLWMGMIIAFSMYSKIPVPRVSWQEKNMRYAICAFPLVGAVIGVVFYLWEMFCLSWGTGAGMGNRAAIIEGGALLTTGIPEWTRICLAAAIPLIITGGIHVDGLMDTFDALHSYQDREKKLEILKDPHIGAFSVIMLLLSALLGLGGLAMIRTERQIVMMGLVFVLARILSGISVVTFPNAKREGTLYTFSSLSHKRMVRFLLMIELILCLAAFGRVDWRIGGLVTCASGLFFVYYWHRTKESFGGITGDLAGWFLCICEIMNCLLIGVAGFL